MTVESILALIFGIWGTIILSGNGNTIKVNFIYMFSNICSIIMFLRIGLTEYVILHTIYMILAIRGVINGGIKGKRTGEKKEIQGQIKVATRKSKRVRAGLWHITVGCAGLN